MTPLLKWPDLLSLYSLLGFVLVQGSVVIQDDGMGEMVKLKQYLIDESFITESVTTNTRCGCRIKCMADSRCKSVSVVKKDDVFSCGLSESTFGEWTVSENSGGAVYYWTSETTGMYHLTGPDNLVYVSSSSKDNYAGALEFCKPPFRLAVMKDESLLPTLESLREQANQELIMNMKKEDGIGKWCDGTVFSKTSMYDVISEYKEKSEPDKDVMIVYKSSEKFEDKKKTERKGILCQEIPSAPEDGCQ